jgi:hypothetical protein
MFETVVKIRLNVIFQNYSGQSEIDELWIVKFQF